MNALIQLIFLFLICEKVIAGCNQQKYDDDNDNQANNCGSNYNNYDNYNNKNECPSVPLARNFDLEHMLGHWYIIETTLDLPDCAFAVRSRIPKYYYNKLSYGSSSSSSGGSGGYGGGNSNYGPQTSYDYPITEEQMLTVNYFDRNSNRARTRYMGNTTRVSYNGGSYTNMFTSGSVSDVKILYVDYDYQCGYVLMITCTTQANGQFEVNSNILSRSSWLDPDIVRWLHGILTRNGLQSVESRLKPIDHQNCQIQTQASYSKYK